MGWGEEPGWPGGRPIVPPTGAPPLKQPAPRRPRPFLASAHADRRLCSTTDFSRVFPLRGKPYRKRVKHGEGVQVSSQEGLLILKIVKSKLLAERGCETPAVSLQPLRTGVSPIPWGI